MKLLLTCPNMIARYKRYKDRLTDFDVTIPQLSQSLSESELVDMIEPYHIWIVGDDPVTEKVVQNGVNLQMVIKWGIGIDNIDREALKSRDIYFTNTPGMFGSEVADVAIAYLIMLVRELGVIDREVKRGNWYKPMGKSLRNKKICLVGFGDIGRSIARRLLAMSVELWVSDPGFRKENGEIKCNYDKHMDLSYFKGVELGGLDSCLEDAFATILACPSNPSTKGFICNNIFYMKRGSYLVNVSRGDLVNEQIICEALEKEHLAGFASDVFVSEPLPYSSKLRDFDNVIFGSHNGSNCEEAVDRTSNKVIDYILEKIE